MGLRKERFKSFPLIDLSIKQTPFFLSPLGRKLQKRMGRQAKRWEMLIRI